MDKIHIKLHQKRLLTEKKIRQLEKQGKAKQRYTITLTDMQFLITGLLCDVGWLIHLIFEIKYLSKYEFHHENKVMLMLDILSLIALLIVIFGVIYIIYLNIIHEKEIATRCQKNLGFGTTVWGGLIAAVIGILQFFIVDLYYIGTDYLMMIIIGGFLNFIFGLPVLMSFKKGIIYSDI